MTELIISVIIANAGAYGIDPKLAVAIAKSESNFDPVAIGPLKERGIFQVRPEYSKYTVEQLYNININVHEGLRILAEAKRNCRHQVNNTWVVCFNAGVAGGSRLLHPELFPYYLKIRRNLIAVTPLMVAAQ